MIKNNKGLTLVTLIITIIVLAIIAGITVYSGLDTIKRTNLESMRTNMLLIQAKAKEYVEEAKFKIGPSSTANSEEKKNIQNQVFGDELGLENALNQIEDFGDVTIDENYWLMTDKAFETMGLNKIFDELEENEKYVLKIDIDNAVVEVYNTLGYQGRYSLTQLEEI